MNAVEMRMLRWINGNTRKNRIKEREYARQVRETPIKDKRKENYI